MQTLCEVLIHLTTIYIYIIIGGAIASWLRVPDSNPLMRVIYRSTEPIYEKLRSMLPLRFGGIDIAPLILMVLITIFRKWLIRFVENNPF